MRKVRPRIRMNRLSSTIVGSVIALGILIAPGFAQEEWRTLSDELYGCRMEYPAGVFHEETTAPGRPLKFSGPNNETFFQIMGSANSEGLSPARSRVDILETRCPAK